MRDEEAMRRIRARIQELRLEHGDLDAAIDALSQSVYVDQLRLQRLKKRRLFLKDQIAKLESMLIPDLDA